MFVLKFCIFPWVTLVASHARMLILKSLNHGNDLFVWFFFFAFTDEEVLVNPTIL